MYKKLIFHSASRYFIVGLLAFGSDYSLLLISYYIFGLPLKLATTIGFFTGFLISFTINKQWVFAGEQRKRTHRQVAEYIALLIFNYLFTVYAVSIINNHGLGPAISKVLVMALIMCWNYALFRWVIFTKKD
jgi:putative flippase GtrA